MLLRIGSSICAAFSALIWLAALPAQAAPTGSAPEMMEVYAQDEAGNYLAHGMWQIDGEWHTFSCGDPLGLEAQGPLSRQPFPPAQCPPGVVNTAVNAQSQVRPAGAQTQCPYESLHPSGHLYMTDLPNGNTLLLRLQASAKPAVVQVKFRGETIDLQPTDPLTVARVQMQGADPPREPGEGLLEDEVTRQDIRSLIAYTDRADQQAELMRAAEVVSQILARYQQRHGQFPAALGDLSAGVDGVIYALPRNPYDWSVSLGAEPAQPGIPDGVYYYPEPSADGSKITGYWLAVTGAQGDAQPALPLPQGAQPPAPIIRWLELHSTAEK